MHLMVSCSTRRDRFQERISGAVVRAFGRLLDSFAFAQSLVEAAAGVPSAKTAGVGSGGWWRWGVVSSDVGLGLGERERGARLDEADPDGPLELARLISSGGCGRSSFLS